MKFMVGFITFKIVKKSVFSLVFARTIHHSIQVNYSKRKKGSTHVYRPTGTEEGLFRAGAK